MRCCICSEVITNSDPSILFVGVNSDEKVICEACEKKLNTFHSHADKQKKLHLCEFFYKNAKLTDDPEVSKYLLDMLKADGYKLLKVEKEAEEERATKSSWCVFLRFIISLEIIIGCIGSILLGIELGQIETVLGIIVAILSIITLLTFSSAVMVFLDMASDIRAIRRQTKR